MTRFWNWGVGIATVYTIFAGATVGFVAFAMTERVDLVSPEYYAESLEHDAKQTAGSRTLALGSSFRIEQAAGIVTITWPAAARPDNGRISMYRPADSASDRSIAVAADTQGRQVVSLESLPAGSWILQCNWVSGGLKYYAEQRLDVR
jgi:hypothetical protein